MFRFVFVLAAFASTGCATMPPSASSSAVPSPAVSRGVLPSLNGSYHQVRRGETLWRIARSYGLTPEALAGANQMSARSPLSVGQRLFIPLPAESASFLWPGRGTSLRTSSFHGVDITAAPGSLVRASRSGRVAVAARRLSGWGKTVIVDHLDGHLTVYTGMDQLLAVPGSYLRQGTPLGRVGQDALHFEIRFGHQPKNTLALLPE